MHIQSIDMMIKFQCVHFSTVRCIWGSLKLSQNSPGCLESKSLLKSRLGLLDTNPDMSRDQLAYLEVVFIFTKGMSNGISHLVNNWEEKAAMGTLTNLQPADEEDKLEYKDDREEHLSCICVQLLTSNERETKVKVCCHIYHLNAIAHFMD